MTLDAKGKASKVNAGRASANGVYPCKRMSLLEEDEEGCGAHW